MLKTFSTFLPSDFTWDLQVHLGDETSELMRCVWPRYLIEKSDLEETPHKTELSDDELASRFSMWGIRRKADGKLVAFASAVLIPIDLNAKSYSDSGWGFALEAYYSKERPNCLCLLSANVDPNLRNLKFSYALLEAAKELAVDFGFNTVLAPVRPTQKSKFLEMPMDEYIEKKSREGEIFDPWLRTHVKLGGEILNVCSQSVIVKATLSKWQEWLGHPIQNTQDLQLPMGLSLLKVDAANNIGFYVEPNIWVRYRT
jgi:hypothetical protein